MKKLATLIFSSIFLVGLFLTVAPQAHAQSTISLDATNIEKARVLQIISTSTENVTGTTIATQNISVEVLDGPDQGKVVDFLNDYTQLGVGDTFYIDHQPAGPDSPESWSVSDPYRLNILGWLLGIFVILVFLFGGWQGVRGLATLAGSLLLIYFVLLPGILDGYSAILVSIGVSALIIIVGSYITHGFNRTTSAAVLAMIATVIVTGLGGYLAIHLAHLSGFTSEESTYLNFDARGSINMVGLLFGGVMIGLLGVLYDIAIGQAVAVEELLAAHRSLSVSHAFWRAIRIGREHIGALVNTLAIAYVGASLPLLLLFRESGGAGFGFAINSEVIATEIVRILIGGIGVVLAMPLTTAVAAWMLRHRARAVPDADAKGERLHP